jgi:hypothetical protein
MILVHEFQCHFDQEGSNISTLEKIAYFQTIRSEGPNRQLAAELRRWAIFSRAIMLPRAANGSSRRSKISEPVG